MKKEKLKRIAKRITALAAAAALAATFSLPAGTEIMGVNFGNAIVASAAVVASGTCGTDVNWSLDSDGTLTISGSGEMNNWLSSSSDVPWYSKKNSIISVVIDYGVTSIGSNAFLRYPNLRSVDIPESVTSIGSNAFSECTSLTGITIPDSVTSIKASAFYRCTYLTSVSFGENSRLETIKNYAFEDCTSLASITIPSGVTSIELQAFAGCTNLASISFGENSQLNSIGEWVFNNCTSLTSVTIPDNVTSIGTYAFKNCTSLESIFLPKDLDVSSANIRSEAAQVRYTVDGDNVTVTDIAMGSQTSVSIPSTIGGKTVTAVFIEDGKNVTAPASAAQIKYTVDGDNVTVTDIAMGSQTSLTIPDTIGGKTVTVVFIDDGKNVTAPASATQIKYTVDGDNVTITRATLGSGQTSVTIPEKIGGKAVTAIGNSAFEGCTNLEKVTLPDSIISIGNSAFIRCTSLSSTNIPNGVTSIGENAFISCSSLGSITIPSSVTSIGRGALNSCSSITVDDSNPNYSSKDGVLFNKNGTTLIAYPINKSGDSYIIPNGVKSIEECAFLACKSLTSITIPDSVTSIGDEAFLNCLSLTSVTIPDSVIFVGEWAFLGCTSLESVFLPNDLNVINADIPDSTTKVRYTIDNDGNVTITGVELNGQTSVNFPDSIGGKPVASVCIKEGTTGVNIPDSLTQVSYTVDDEGNVTITEVTLGDGQTSFDIPETIGGNPVTDIADGVLEACPDVPHTHREKTAATCTEKPVCSICGQEYDSALGHSYTNYVSDDNATCTENGTETAECDNGCGETDTREIADSALGHDHSGDWQNDTADHWKVCERENCTEKLDLAAHTYGAWKITVPATAEANGKKERSCTVCGYVQEGVVTYGGDESTGDIDNATDPDTNACHADLELTDEEIIEKIPLTPEELESIENGANLEVYMVVIDYSGNVPSADKALAEAILTGDMQIGMYIDVTLFVKVGDNDPRAVTETNGDLKITFEMPEKLINTEKNVTREYSIIRVHSGVATVLDCEYDNATNKGSFVTDKFSSYAIAYRDIEEEEPAPEPEKVIYYPVITSGNVVADKSYAAAGQTVNVIAGFGYDIIVTAANGRQIAKITDKGSFVMPASKVYVKAVQNETFALMATAWNQSYVYSYDADMNKIKVNSTKKRGVIVIDLGEEYAGRTFTIYSGRKSTKVKVTEGVLDENGKFVFEVPDGKNYTLIVED